MSAKRLMLVAAVGMVLAAPVLADTEFYDFTINDTLVTNGSPVPATITVPKFDTTGSRVLSKVTITFTADTTTNWSFSNTSTSATSSVNLLGVNGSAALYLSPTYDDVSPLTASPAVSATGSPILTVPKATGVFSPGLASYGPQTDADTATRDYIDSTPFTSVGADTLYLRFVENAGYSFTIIGGATTPSQQTYMDVVGRVTYVYNVVPEAGTMLLGGCAVMPILAYRRRSRKA